MIDWQRRRHPDDVPTPIAVALADFCRRAKAPASPKLVREALSCVAEADDFRVKAITDEEPAARPLGPYAVIDLLEGTDAQLCAQREQAGYYELVKSLVAERDKHADVAPAPAEAAEADEVAEEEAAPAPSAPRRAKKAEPAAKKLTKAERVQARVQPKHRDVEEEPRAKAQPAPPATSFLPKRDLPAPRGRFANVDPSRSVIDVLLRDDAKATVTALLEQSSTRYALLRSLESGYTARKGAPLTLADVEDVIERHGLGPALERKERDGIVAHIGDQKGALGRVSGALGITAGQLQLLIDGLSLTKQVKDVRERYSREALSPQNLPLRLDLLGRSKYLDDLQLQPKFDAALARDVGKLLAEAGDEGSVDERVERVAKKHALNAQLLRRAVDRLGLLETAR